MVGTIYLREVQILKELDNDLENNIKIENNFVYPDMDDEDYDKSEVESSIHTDINEEYRVDPYDGNLYTKSEFQIL